MDRKEFMIRILHFSDFHLNGYHVEESKNVLSYMMNTTIVPQFGGRVEAEEIGLPVTESGLILPCGASGRWCK